MTRISFKYPTTLTFNIGLLTINRCTLYDIIYILIYSIFCALNMDWRINLKLKIKLFGS